MKNTQDEQRRFLQVLYRSVFMEVKFYKDENADAFYVRRKVFVEEQNIPECDEFDGSDIGVIQAVVYDNNSPVARDLQEILRIGAEQKRLWEVYEGR